MCSNTRTKKNENISTGDVSGTAETEPDVVGRRTAMHGTLCTTVKTKSAHIKMSRKKKRGIGKIERTCVKIKNKKKNGKKIQTATMPTSVAGMGALAGGMSGVPATAMPGGLQSASMASIELGKKRMRDSNDDLLMVPRLMHGVHFPFFFFFFLFFCSWTPVKWPRYCGRVKIASIAKHTCVFFKIFLS